MFGANQRVDIITTRKNKFGRFQIAVLNSNIVPRRMDVVIGAQFFELEFEIERYEPTPRATTFLKRSGDEGDGKANEDRDVNNLGGKNMGSTSRSV
jgi:hypothetical protein